MGTLDLNEVIALYRRAYPSYSPSDVFFAANYRFARTFGWPWWRSSVEPPCPKARPPLTRTSSIGDRP